MFSLRVPTIYLQKAEECAGSSRVLPFDFSRGINSLFILYSSGAELFSLLEILNFRVRHSTKNKSYENIGLVVFGILAYTRKEDLMALRVVATPANRELGAEVCQYLGIKMLHVEYSEFSDQEVNVKVRESCAGDIVAVIGGTHMPEKNAFYLGHTSLALRQARVRKVMNVIPYLFYARADKNDETESGVYGTALGAQFAINVICQGLPDEVLLMDIHAGQLQGFFPAHIRTQKLYAGIVSVPYIQDRLDRGNTVIASPDEGSFKRTLAYAKYLGLNEKHVAVFTKARKKANEVDPASVRVIGPALQGQKVWFIDDIVDTGGTIKYAACKADNEGAASVSLYATHPVLSGRAVQTLDESPLVEFVTTNSIPKKPEELRTERLKITVLSHGRLISEAIKRMYEEKPLNDLILSTQK
ncbi:MAG: hypothetical protein A3B74_01090 [Candidatus Kerfeldbacteria bacterium RIFCSPHIGHO2_02_FULL_42_14]|uniref:ribose-phosphate diphosphokinase n=1 Tax=Candidatus Kerfeldbacteria bacterium RIFCSPHIGHO2_02_FULL_42_14 TaxID=1798540 RepID=A0A1G2ATV5_9BACT|nr:MAG: hypothetical protein A3B74_01090 [Candidatus Kerfeldbacteria bacterium RIFCSPHIGHO2_02_FULL_42_14]OGY81945.1 MAG: hypothetical protein A3E60_01170 [Candidatus Kerfeldbacteria bacterium RIFCSPHIGHO2_12_FULL_42_13]OGY83420.1 MAG: hypothetical protein A3I91_02085 [Candidatus Kerfeldbacteria bacterium RIFCSPLOWO2_02_FULL_42_19]OGY85569.1 MAG: hypothetical protein A3G01_03735 [Candidatus Kerfeldbacteria bacterium RIFCSPLOWO2_12_FULL_43_9]